MYTIDQVMQVIYANPMFAVTASFITYGFGFVQYGASMFMQVRNRRCPFYFWMHCWYFGHDITFSLLFHQWFVEIGYWLFEVLCVGCMCFVLIEIFSLYQSVRNERQEIWGGYYAGRAISERSAWMRGIAGYAIGALLFCCIRLIIGDVMCLILMASTNAILALMVHFRSEEFGIREPGTILLAWATLLGTVFTFAPKGIGFFATLIAPLNTPAYYAIGVLCVACSVRAVWLAHTLPTVRQRP
ncbi:hypothetical protein [Bifidobacterium scaligerum]|uniref:Uncharacterized protein n=1 Tax=Bifidobacterium scaligerum TaxID=2052656 RepID=A0A2M9HSN6_9BIFI|nr:hypothetical protein [Bifidobacterium scaligerum]PJM79817.1 hypothetical protein CUU80_01340 [Bifidobacterium scaligerum]